MTARQQRRLAPRPGRWVRKTPSGQGGQTCDLCLHTKHEQGWAFLDAGQVTTTSAFLCDPCAEEIVKP